jgi:hypothetical protein
VALVESRVGAEGPDEIFSGVDTALVALTKDLPEEIKGEVTGGLLEYREAIAEAEGSLGLTDPWQSARPLGRALEILQATVDLVDLVGLVGGDASTGAGIPELVRSLRERVPVLKEALLRAAGVVMEVRVNEDLLVPGEVVGGVVELWNGGPYPIGNARASLAVPMEWRVSGEIGETRDVPSGALAQWRFQIQVPSGAEPSVAYFLAEPRDGELYRWTRSVSQWAAAANDAAIHGSLEFEVGDLGRVGVWRPARFRGVDKATGEYVEPIQVVPALSVTLDPALIAWPSGGPGVREFQVTVRSQTDRMMDGTVSLQLPPGWRGEPQEAPVSLSEAGAEASITFRVTRTAGVSDGRYPVAARVRTVNGQLFESGVTLVDYPHIRRGVLFPSARSWVSVFPVTLPVGMKVGYVMGSGDAGPDAIRQMGAQVELLGPEAVRAGEFGSYDVVVLGIRAYETRPELIVANDRFLGFVRAGGTLIVQYNKYEYPRGNFAPFHVEMNRPHDRVSDEAAPVRILDSSHPVFRSPNAIGPGDFDGWVQERGLYFLGSWDQEFTPLMEMGDPGEDPKQGGLLVAEVGEGVYVYTGLAFFRQFPEGVPGAHRLFANLLSLRADDLH